MPRETSESADLQAALRRVCAELERRLRAGEDCSAERLLASHSPLSDDADAALEVIYTEFVAREQLGQRPDASEFCRRFPRFRDGLEQLFQIHGAAGGASLISAAGPSLTPLPDGERLNALAKPATDGSLRRISNYEILGEIGRGGMGVVYRARQVGLNRLVALKMILTGADAGPAERARFRAEAESAARLQHSNIVQIYEVGEHEGRPFLSLELVEGGSLETRLNGTPWSAADSARLVQTLGRAMHHAHQQGVVHRDLKPANILLQKDEGGTRKGEAESSFVAKITDFGLARRINADKPALTATGAIVGTPAYMAPEQAAGDAKETGPSADVYALGAILYELLTGRPPFQGVTVLETLEQVRTQEPVPPSRLVPKLPRDIETICLKCLRKEPARRYVSAADLADDLGRYVRGEPIRARPTLAWEKAWKWMRRRPATASLMVLLFSLMIISLTVITLLWRKEAAAVTAVKAERDEKEAALASKLIALAHSAWINDEFDQARQALDECPPAYRSRDWQYLERVCHAELGRLIGHGSELSTVAFSPDSSRLASVSRNGAIILWDVSKQQRIWATKGQFPCTLDLQFSLDGSQIVLARLAGPGKDVQSAAVVVGLDAASGREVWRWQPAGGIDAVAFSCDARKIVYSAHGANKLVVAELPSGQVTTTVPLNPRLKVARQCFNPDCSKVGSLMHGGGLFIWDSRSGELLRTFKFPSHEWCQVAFSPDGRKVVTAANEARAKSLIMSYDVETGSETSRFKSAVTRTLLLAFSPDGRYLATGNNINREVFLWDATTGTEVLTLRGHLSGIMSLAFSPDGRLLATGGNDTTVRIWDVSPFDNLTNK